MIHLHLHSEYSLLDGMCKVKHLLDKCKELGMNSVAITDHGVMYGALDLYFSAKKAGIKPIIGCEVYVTENRAIHSKKEMQELEYNQYHLILLAQNHTGYKNLLSIVTDSYINGFFSKPRTDLSVLERYNEGIIALSACVAGQIPQAILSDDEVSADQLITKYSTIFKDRFYLEVQANNMPEQEKINSFICNYSKQYNIPMVMTCDVHYLNKEDSLAHEVLLAAQTKQIVGSEKAIKFSCNDFWFKSEKEVYLTTLGMTKEEINIAISNTHVIADKCNIEIEFGANLLPVCTVPDGYTVEEYLTKLCYESLFNYYLTSQIDYYKYKERLDYELSVINNAGFAAYFIIVSDFIQWGKNRGITFGPGRGSAAGSIVSYLLRITDKNLDPIKHGMLFERFLNPERVEMPDIDIDVHPDDRYLVIEYIRHRYGLDNVAQIGTLGRMAARGTIKKVGAALDIDYATRDSICKLIPSVGELKEDEELNIETALNHSEELRKYKEEYPILFKISEMVEGSPSNASIHAGGVVIAPCKVSEYTPLQLGRDDEVVTQFTMDTIAKLGLLKVDVLGLKTLKVIKQILDSAREYFDDVPLQQEDIDTSDPEPYKMLCNLETEGIFQVESNMFRKIIKEMQPRNFSEWTDLVALGRPGPLYSGMVDSYIKRKHGREEIVYVHPKLETILHSTYGVIVYQEQVMAICRALAGYSLGEADKVRKIMGKKKAELLAPEKEKFLKRCSEQGEDVEVCEKIWNDMEFFAQYAFNIPHSACYALISYRTMWLKYKYPAQFYAAVLSNESAKNNNKKESKVITYINKARDRGINILPPDINKSELSYKAEGTGIRMGLVGITGVGGNAAEQIIFFRPYSSLSDFDSRMNNSIVNKKVMTALIYSGCFDNFSKNRNKLYLEYLELRKGRGLKDSEDISLIPLSCTRKDIMNYEVQYLGFTVSSMTKWDRCKNGEYFTLLGEVKTFREHTTKNGKLMGFIDVVNDESEVAALLFLEQWLQVRERLDIGMSLSIRGQKSEGKLIAKSVKIIEETCTDNIS